MKDRFGPEDLEFIESELPSDEAWGQAADLLDRDVASRVRARNLDHEDGSEEDKEALAATYFNPGEGGLEQDVVRFDSTELDELLENLDSVESVGVESDVSWEEFALLEDDTHEDDQDEDSSDQRLSREDRALQVAAEIASEAGWTRDEAFLLAEVLAYHSVHGKTRGALRALTCEWGVSPEELQLLFDVRAAWRAGGFNRTYWASTAYDGWPNLSWQQALRITRELRYASVEEVMLFLDDCFEDWAHTPRLINAYFNFSSYLDAVIRHMDSFGRGDQQLMPPFVDYAWFDDEEEAWAPGTPEWNELFAMGLLADHGLGSEKFP